MTPVSTDQTIAHLRALLSDRAERLRRLKFWAHRLGLPNSLAGNEVRRLLNVRRPLRQVKKTKSKREAGP